MFPEDEILLKNFDKSSSQQVAFEGIVRKYSRLLFAHLSKYIQQREDIEDVLQIVWIKVWKNLHSFRKESLLSTWLYTITTREAYNFYKSRKLQSVELKAEEHFHTSDQIDINMNASDILMKLQNAIDTLPPKQKEVFVMRYFEEMSYEAMSQKTSTSVGALKASYHHAVKKIEFFIKGD
ncbi:MAG TPA: RNA polymerase sigma factor [Chitinophagales bacterium]|nr:RNA polymerase sigma factor [Chitinophagales bacterium]